MKRILFTALLATGCAHAPATAPASPVRIGFSAPRGGAQLELVSQDRLSRVQFPGRDAQVVRESVRSAQQELWRPLPDGGWRITRTQLDESAARDGQPVASAVPLTGVPFVHRIDDQGRFVAAEELAESIRAVEDRVPSRELRRMLTPLLTPEMLTSRIAEDWARRTAGLCNTTLMSGQRVVALDFQPLPVAGPAVTLARIEVASVRQQEGVGDVVELRITFGGLKDSIAAEAGAAEALAGLPETVVVAEHASGTGRRLVALDSCRVIDESASIEGHWSLKPAAAALLRQSGGEAAVPERISFEVRRSARRSDGPEAARATPLPLTPARVGEE